MASFREGAGAATSPCRRDYQLRSFSLEKLSEFETSRPQSPWLPRASSQSVSRCGSPMPSYFGGSALPDFLREGSDCSSSRGEEEGDIDEVGEVLYSSYLKRKEEARSSRMSPTRRGRMRNCVSGDLGMRFEHAHQRAQAARGCKSGDLGGVEVTSDGLLASPDMRSEVEALVKVGREISMRRQMSERRSSEALAIVAIDERREMVAVDDVPSVAMVEIPFKWEEMPVELSTAAITKEASSGSRHRYYGGARESESVSPSPAPLKLEKSSSVSSSDSVKRVVSSAVPFKWELEPGKPKAEERASSNPEAAPALQLPPRLSSRRSSSSMSAPSSRRNSNAVASAGNRARQSLSASVSTSMQQQDVKPRRTLATVFQSDSIVQSDCPPLKRAPVSSQFGSPQYQSADYLCEDSVPWNRAHSPTSTLCGPGSDSHSTPSSCKSDKSSRDSGTSAESFEQWSYGDHISPTSRQPSERFSRANSVRGHEDEDAKITKLRRKLILSSKPPRQSSIRAPSAASSSRSIDVNGYSSHGEEYFDCHEEDEEAEVERPTRLPYKMPSPVHEPQAPSTSSSRCESGDFSYCLGLPKFLSKGETPGMQWVENPSWDLPTTTVEDGYRSPAYKATLELLSPSPNLMSKKTGSRPVSKLPRSGSTARRRHPHLVEVLCNSFRQSIQRCTKRSVSRTQSTLGADQFTKRHQSFMW